MKLNYSFLILFTQIFVIVSNAQILENFNTTKYTNHKNECNPFLSIDKWKVSHGSPEIKRFDEDDDDEDYSAYFKGYKGLNPKQKESF